MDINLQFLFVAGFCQNAAALVNNIKKTSAAAVM